MKENKSLGAFCTRDRVLLGAPRSPVAFLFDRVPRSPPRHHPGLAREGMKHGAVGGAGFEVAGVRRWKTRQECVVTELQHVS